MHFSLIIFHCYCGDDTLPDDSSIAFVNGPWPHCVIVISLLILLGTAVGGIL